MSDELDIEAAEYDLFAAIFVGKTFAAVEGTDADIAAIMDGERAARALLAEVRRLTGERDAANARITAATDRLADLYGDSHLREQMARGAATEETLEVLAERAVVVGRAAMMRRDEALQSARVEGARGMLTRCRQIVEMIDVSGDEADDVVNEVDDALDALEELDPAAVVGSGS